MTDPDVALPSAAQKKPSSRAGARWLVRRAPDSEPPQVRDPSGARLGMLILLIGGGLFWVGVAALLVVLFR